MMGSIRASKTKDTEETSNGKKKYEAERKAASTSDPGYNEKQNRWRTTCYYYCIT